MAVSGRKVQHGVELKTAEAWPESDRVPAGEKTGVCHRDCLPGFPSSCICLVGYIDCKVCL